MALTIEYKPERLTPAYNEVTYLLDSTDKNKDGHRYFAEVFDDSSNLLLSKKVPKRIGDGFGVIDIQKEVANLVSFDYKLDVNANYDAKKSYKNLKINFGEEYFEEWKWDDFIFAGSGASWWTDGNNPQINPNGKNRVAITKTSIGSAPTYQIGDFINIELNTGTQDFPYIQGIHKVIDVVNINQTLSGQFYGWAVITEVEWSNSGSSTGGTSNYADGSRSKFTRITGEELTVFNSAFKNTDFVDYVNTDWSIGLLTSNVLSIDVKSIREDSFYLMNLLLGEPVSLRINFKNDSGDESYIGNSTTSFRIIQANVGTNRNDYGTIINGSFPIIKPNTKWYEVTITDWSNVAISKTYRIYIDRSCLVSQVDCLFIDIYGSFIPYTFGLKKEETNNVSRSIYEKGLPINYSKDDVGSSVFNSEYSRSLLLRTGYLADDNSNLLPHLMRSPVLLINYEDEWVCVNIKTSTFAVQKDRWKDLIKYELTVDFANKEKINI